MPTIKRVMNLDVDGLAEDENGVIYAIRGRRETAEGKYVFHDAHILEDYIFVLEYFRINQPELGFVHRWEVPALTRIIKKLFGDKIHHKKAHNLAYLFKLCSQIANEVF